MQERQLTLPDIWQILWRRKLWLILPLILVTAVAFGGSYFLPVVYQSSTRIIISTAKLVSPELERMLPSDLGGLPTNRYMLSDWLASTRSEIKSTDYVNALINDLNLQPDDEIVKQAAKMQEQFPDYDLRTIIRKLQIDQLRDKIDVDMVGQSQIIISCSSSNPKLANEMATKLAEVYREKKLADEVRSARESQLFTDQQLALAQREYADAEAALVQFKNSYIADRLEQGISSEGNLNQIDSEIDATRLDIMEATDRRNFLVAEMLTAGLDTTAATADFPSLRVHVDNALDNTQEIASLMNKYIWRDAKIQGLQTKVGYALEDLRGAAGDIAASHYSHASSQQQQTAADLIYRDYQIEFLNGKEKMLREAIDSIK
ncbi:MAG: Wzz/FepE/Etk N-terminal domain-containing protein, partial [bacterium]